jgi:hypothetical protein
MLREQNTTFSISIRTPLAVHTHTRETAHIRVQFRTILLRRLFGQKKAKRTHGTFGQKTQNAKSASLPPSHPIFFRTTNGWTYFLTDVLRLHTCTIISAHALACGGLWPTGSRLSSHAHGHAHAHAHAPSLGNNAVDRPKQLHRDARA